MTTADRNNPFADSWDALERMIANRTPEEEAEIERSRAEYEERKRLDAIAATRAWLLKSGVPAKDIGIAMGEREPSETEAMVQMRRWAASDATMLVLSGEKGCGKTTAASWLLGQPKAFGRMVTASRLVRVDVYDDAVVDEFAKSDLLVIDDLGMEFSDAKGFFMAFLDGLIDERYRQCRRTVITTNLPSEPFKARYGERIADRLRECGKFVGLTSKSMRGRQ